MPEAGDVALASMRRFVAELVHGGVRHVCLTAGSRSTPIALAVVLDPRLTVHVHVDERSSAYFALGVAKASGAPAVAMCSSGTAAANHLPAVVEASMAREPLIVLTADRPPELHGVGANQTIDQQHLFGGYVRRFEDAGVPDEGDDPGRWGELARRAIGSSTAHPPGPVHVNLPFREPLVPADPPAVAPPAANAGVANAPRVRRPPDPRDLDAMHELLSGPRRVAVVAGSFHGDAATLLDAAAARGWPVLAEPASRLRAGSALSMPELLVADEDFRATHRAELVLQVGAAPTTRAMQAFVREAATVAIVDPDSVVGDPDRRAALRIDADVAPVIDALPPPSAGAELSWLESWQRADRAVRREVDAVIDGWDEPFEGRIARDVAAAVPAE